MAKSKTPEHLRKARESLLAFHDPSTIKAGIPLEPRTTPPTPTIQQWERIDPLLAGLEGVIPPERFAAINDKLQSVNMLLIIVQNLSESSRADVLSRRGSAIGGRKGGRGHRRDGSDDQATDAEVEDALETILARGIQLKREAVAQDAVDNLKKTGKNCGDRKARKILTTLLEKKPLLALNLVRAAPLTIVRKS